MGVSSVTTYVESGAGVAEGARTGLASLVTAGLFALALLFVPLIALVGQGVQVGEDVFIHPADRARAGDGRLPDDAARRRHRLVGARAGAARPSSIIAGIPLTFSIAAGIGFGVLGYVLAMVALKRDARPAPADVGGRRALRPLLHGRLAQRERLLIRG